MELRPRRRRVNHRTGEPDIFPWEKLPSILRHAILKNLVTDRNYGAPGRGKRYAAYATVCSEWQAFFEEINFGKLILRDSDVVAFKEIVKRRAKGRNTDWCRTRSQRALAATTSSMPRIRHVWLRVELHRYGCWFCREPQGKLESLKCVLPNNLRCRILLTGDLFSNNIIFTRALWGLLDAFSTWERLDPNHGQELTLELSAHSRSDSDHLLRGDAEHRKDYPHSAGIDLQRNYIERDLKPLRGGPISQFHQFLDRTRDHDLNGILAADALAHGPTNARPVNMNRGSAERLISPLFLDFPNAQPWWRHRVDPLPEVRMVSCFLMRRQYYRFLARSTLMELVGESLTGLRSIRLEPWRPIKLMSQYLVNDTLGLGSTTDLESRHIGSDLVRSLPRALETLSVFEDFSTKMHGAFDSSRPRPSVANLILWLAHYTPNIKNIAISFLSDAKNCLNRADQRLYQTYPKLESLALTSQQCLEPTDKNTEGLMLLAAAAAQKMPSLQIMEIWTCGAGHAAILRYEATGTPHSSDARLTWRASWDSWDEEKEEDKIDWEAVVAAWEKVAHTNAFRELRFASDPLPRDPNRYKKHGAIMHLLKLRNFIADPTSVMQLRMGTGAEDEPEVEAWRPRVPDSYWSSFANDAERDSQ